MKLNNKGFTLIEVLAVIVIIALLTGITVPSVINSMNASKENAYKIMVSNINTASIELFEEIYYSNGTVELYKYDDNGNITSELINIDGGEITINLQTLVSNGYLTGNSSEETSRKVILNPRDSENIGYCEITINREIEEDTSKVIYTITSNGESNCPTNNDYINGVN